MHQTKKGNQWYLDLKAHTGTDAESGLVHSLHVTPTNESDVAHAYAVLHGKEVDVFADAGYVGVEKLKEIVAGQAQQSIHQDIHWNIAQRRSTWQKMAEGPVKELKKARSKPESALG